VWFFDHLSDFMIPDFRFRLHPIATLTWAFGSIHKRKKRLVLIPILVWDYKCLYQYFTFFAYNGATGTSVSLTAIPAISWWSYLVVLVCLLLLPLFMHCKIFLPNGSVYA
jgi:hypothetical protein